MFHQIQLPRKKVNSLVSEKPAAILTLILATKPPRVLPRLVTWLRACFPRAVRCEIISGRSQVACRDTRMLQEILETAVLDEGKL